MFSVDVKIDDEVFKKYVSDYVARACHDEIDRQLKTTTRSMVTGFISCNIQKILREPEFVQTLRDAAYQLLAVGEELPKYLQTLTVG